MFIKKSEPNREVKAVGQVHWFGEQPHSQGGFSQQGSQKEPHVSVQEEASPKINHKCKYMY